MKLSGKHVAVSVLFCIVFITVSCSSSGTATRGQADGDQQTEQDILRLLGVEDRAPSMEPDAYAMPGPGGMMGRVTDLENMLMDKESEINELKAELVLKEERLDELQGNLSRGAGGMFATSRIASFESEYQAALGLYRNGHYQRAIQEFQRLLSMDMNNSLSDNCQYWTGECYYGLKNYRQAIIEFEKVFTFSHSNKDPDSQLKLGLCYKNLGDNNQARTEFGRLIANYPKSEYVARARQYQSRLP